MADILARVLANSAKRLAGSGNTMALLGDSITALNVPTGGALQDAGYFNWANVMLGHRFQVVAYAGVGGNTTAQMLARLDTDVLSHSPDWCVVLGGTNDINTGVSDAVAFGNLKTIYQRLISAGVRVIASTVTPSTYLTAGAVTQAWFRLNQRIRQYAQANPAIILADMGSAISDYSTNPPRALANTTSDGVHPSAYGAPMMGKVLADALRPYVPAVPLLGMSNYDVDVINPNVMMTGTTGASGGGAAITGNIADGWYVYATTGTITCSKVARTDGLPGVWQQLVANGGGYEYQETISTGFAQGDQIFAQCEFQTNADWSGVSKVYLVLRARDGASATLVSANDLGHQGSIDQNYNPGSGILCTPSLIVPAGTANVFAAFIFSGTAAAGTVRVGRFEMRKVTV